jgi:hypothetical protein
MSSANEVVPERKMMTSGGKAVDALERDVWGYVPDDAVENVEVVPVAEDAAQDQEVDRVFAVA